MNTTVLDCLSAAGINRVIWIDDYFSTPNRQDHVDSVHAQFNKLIEKGITRIEVVSFSEIDLSDRTVDLHEELDDVMEGMSDEELCSAVGALCTLTGEQSVNPVTQPDLLPSDFDALRTAFGSALTTFSLKAWTSSGVREIGVANEDILFLIDKEFSRESGSIDGSTILADVVSETKAFCIMLTHTCTENEQEQRRVAIATEKNLAPHRFCVLSKQQSGNLEVQPRFANAIRAVMTHRFSGEIAFAICSSIQTAAREMAGELTKQSVRGLEQTLFRNSQLEGVLEYEVVLRLFAIHQRYALNEALQNEPIQKQLRSLRRFREAITPHSDEVSSQTDMGFFADWRKREVFFDGAGLNKLHSPLTCGDVFLTSLESAKKYIFLAQPCDLVVRSNGERGADVGLLVLIKESDSAVEPSKPAGHRYFEVGKIFGGDKSWRIDFLTLFVVDLAVLDFAVFNPDGSVELRKDQSDPLIVLTDGWKQRLRKAKCQMFPNRNGPTISSIGMGSSAKQLKGILVSKEFVRYPLRRIGRVEKNTATAALAAWAVYQTRAALDHDFSRAHPVH